MGKKRLFVSMFLLVMMLPVVGAESTYSIHKGVIDRIGETEVATILLEAIDRQCYMETSLLEDIHEQLWVTVRFNDQDNQCQFIDVDQKRTHIEKKRANNLKEQLQD